MIRRVCEYVWYPALLTAGFYLMVQAGFFDGDQGKIILGGLVFSVALWKLCRFIFEQRLMRRIYLVLAWGWVFVKFALVAGDPAAATYTHKEFQRQASYAMAPLILGVKWMLANRRES